MIIIYENRQFLNGIVINTGLAAFLFCFVEPAFTDVATRQVVKFK
jgi:hypothetical protein